MKISDVIKKLEQYPQDMELLIVDWRKNLSEDCGDGSSAGIYDFTIETEDLTDEEIKHIEDVNGIKFKKIVHLSFDNDDYENDGTKSKIIN